MYNDNKHLCDTLSCIIKDTSSCITETFVVIMYSLI